MQPLSETPEVAGRWRAMTFAALCSHDEGGDEAAAQNLARMISTEAIPAIFNHILRQKALR